MSKLQRDLQHVVLTDEDNPVVLHDLTNRTIFDYWLNTLVFNDFFYSQNVPHWMFRFLRYTSSYSSICRQKWFKDLCHSFRAYLMRHFYFVDRRSVLEKYTLTYIKDVDLQGYLDL